MTVLTINLKDDPEVIAAYRRYHREVWPEVQQSLSGAGSGAWTSTCSGGGW